VPDGDRATDLSAYETCGRDSGRTTWATAA
jgi:hypothetical protein